MSRLIFILILAGACLGLDSLVLQPDATAGKDNYIFTTSPNNNRGANIYWSCYGGPAKYHQLIQYDLSSIPAGAVIDSAYEIVSYSSARTGTYVMLTSRLLREWNEGTSDNSLALVGESCWNYYYYNTGAWTTAGATGIGTDIASPTDSMVITATLDSLKIYVTSTVQAILSAGVNYGWLHWSQYTGTQVYWRGYSSDHTTASARPKLKVYYTVPAAGGVKYRGAYIGNHLHIWRIP